MTDGRTDLLINKKFNKKYIQLKFSISQHMRDKNLFQKILLYFKRILTTLYAY